MQDPADDFPTGDPRARAARTKRARTRAALLNAARQVFQVSGWAGTRMEDVAALARVSVATAYNHFSSKHQLLAHVYAPLVVAELDASRARAEGESGPADALELHVRGLAALVHSHEALTIALTHAMHEYGERVAGPPRADDQDDPRVLVPIDVELRRLIELGQHAGVFRGFPAASDLAALARTQLLTVPAVRPAGGAEATAEVMLTVLFGVLQPERVAESADGRPFCSHRPESSPSRGGSRR